MRTDRQVSMKARMETAQEESFVARRNEWIVLYQESQITLRWAMLLKDFKPAWLNIATDPQRPINVPRLRNHLGLNRCFIHILAKVDHGWFTGKHATVVRHKGCSHQMRQRKLASVLDNPLAE